MTKGFRAIRAGERVRFRTDPGDNGHAAYVIRLDLPGLRPAAPVSFTR